ncbi:MAG: N-acetylglucosaminyl-phosphatidylinositol de-N-acetylase [Piccolia ochrophora]|nr:MAG: N-acetylglucosaminyl-phosphatidylinositol de-N-acetylase [Piccolia ochrophora]
MQWLTALLVPPVIGACWLLTLQFQNTFPTLRNKRICLLIAHPDDEAMFFAPTLLALTRPELGNHVKILCLSSDGLGETRKEELVKSALMLGLRSEDDVFIIEDPNFPDSMTASWDTKRISTVLTRAFVHDKTPKKPTKQTPNNPPAPPPTTTTTTTIDALLTFDAHGVSSHPNHIALHLGARAFLADLTRARGAGWKAPVLLYTLSTTALARKYLSLLDVAVTVARVALRRGKSVEPPSPLLFVSSWRGYRAAQRAMTVGHESQMRWFRWGWIGASRYVVVNDLRLVRG